MRLFCKVFVRFMLVMALLALPRIALADPCNDGDASSSVDNGLLSLANVFGRLGETGTEWVAGLGQLGGCESPFNN
jgi:hypothetical protein